VPFASRDGLDLFYVRAGGGEPPIVFVHGWCCDHTFFEPQFEHLKASHAVLSLDLRGCGRSGRTDGGYGIPSLADDVAWLAAALGLTRPILVGHSLGGMIGIDLAARHPSVPRAVVAVDPGPIDPLPETREFFERFAVDLDGPRGETVRRSYVEETASTTADDELRRRIVETMCAVPLDAAASVIQGVAEWDGVGALERCKVPVLVLRSAPTGSNAPERLLALKPDVHIGMTVGAGHFHQLEVPEQVTPMIERFVRLTTR
jgi:pimeloyl-ACP methyl ester carboxylesterase